MNFKNTLRTLLFLLAVTILFGIVHPAYARLKATAAVYVFDDQAFEYKNSLVAVNLDGQETHVIHELGFDNALYNPYVTTSVNYALCQEIIALSNPSHPQHSKWLENCPTARNTKYAGILQLGIPYQKTETGGTAQFFASSLGWSLVDCDLNRDGSWNTGGGASSDLKFNTLQFPPTTPPTGNPLLLPNWDVQTMPAPPPTTPGVVQSIYFKILAKDVVNNCNTGNCLTELVTTIFVDLDINKDNNLTAAADGVPVNQSGSLPSGRVCFFARVFPITWPTTPASPTWSGNPQARISAGGGDKTVNFRLFGPTAITLEQFGAESLGNVHPAVWLTIFLLLGAITFVLIRERAQGSTMTIRKEE